MQRLADRFGWERVMDVLADTPLERHARELGFRVFLVPGAVHPNTRMQLYKGMELMFINMVGGLGENCVKCSGINPFLRNAEEALLCSDLSENIIRGVITIRPIRFHNPGNRHGTASASEPDTRTRYRIPLGERI